jgi:hypothetical protein
MADPVWKAHREVANATMIDSDNALLLRPARPGSGFRVKNDRPAADAKEKGNGRDYAVGSLVLKTVFESTNGLIRTLDQLSIFLEFFDQRSDDGSCCDAFQPSTD